MALSDSLVAYYSLDEGSSSDNAIDAHGSLDLTVTGTPGVTTGVQGGARTIDAGGKYFTHADDSAFDMGDFDQTFAIWYKPSTLTTYGCLFSKATGGGEEYYLYHNYPSNGGLEWRIDAGAHVSCITAGSLLTDGAWNLIICRHSASANKLFVKVNDGADTEQSYASPPSSSTNTFYLGSNVWTEHTRGDIDEFGIWNRLLTDEECTALYNAGAGLAYPFSTDYTMPADNGTFTLSGTAATLKCARKIVGGNGTFALTGTNAALKATRRMAAANGSYTLTGQTAALRAARKLSAGNGAYVLTGTSADLLTGEADEGRVIWMRGYFEP